MHSGILVNICCGSVVLDVNLILVSVVGIDNIRYYLQ